MKNERERLILFWFSFYSLFGAWKIVEDSKHRTERKTKEDIGTEITTQEDKGTERKT